MKNPVEVSTAPTSSPAENVKQEVLKLSAGDKFKHLTDQLHQRKDL